MVTLANQADFISFRHHTFEQPRGAASVQLTECGPRFELKLYQVRARQWPVGLPAGRLLAVCTSSQRKVPISNMLQAALAVCFLATLSLLVVWWLIVQCVHCTAFVAACP